MIASGGGLAARARARRRTVFVGRKDEIDAVTRNLERPLDDEERWFVLDLSGRQGIGKSSLIARFREILEKKHWVVAAMGREDSELPDVVSCLVDQLPLHSWKGWRCRRGLRKALRRYQSLKADLAKDDEGVAAIANLATATATVVGTAVGGPLAPLAGTVTETGISAVKEATEYVRRRISNDADQDLILTPERVFSRLLVNALEIATRGKWVCMVFDDLDLNTAIRPGWLAELVSGKCGVIPDKVLIVVGSERGLRRQLWERHGVDTLRHRMILRDLSAAEADELLRARGVEDSARTPLIEAAGGDPAALTVMATHGRSVVGGTADDVIATNILTNEAHRDLLLAASIPQSMNADVLTAAVGDPLQKGDWLWLTDRPDVTEQFAGAWQLTPAVRRPLLRRQRSESPSTSREINERLAAWYATSSSADALRARIYHLAAARSAAALNDIILAISVPPRTSDHDSVAHALASAHVDYEDNGLAPLAEGWAKLAAACETEDWKAAASTVAFLHGHDLSDAAAAQVAMWRAAFLMQAEDLTGSLAEIDQAVALTPDARQPRRLRAHLLFLASEYDDAIRELNTLLDEDDELTLRRLRAAVFLATESARKACDDLDAILAKNPNDVPALLQRALALSAITEIDLAIADAERAAEIEPDNAQANLHLAQFRAQRGDPGALEAYAEILDKQARVVARQLTQQVKEIPEGRLSKFISGWCRTQGLSGAMVNRLIEATERAPEELERLIRADAAAARAVVHLRLRQPAEAAAAASSAIDLDPTVTAYYQLQTAGWIGSVGAEAALKAAENALSAGGSAHHHVERFIAFTALGRQDEAIVALDNAIDSLPNDAHVLAMRAQTRLFDNLPGAIEDLERVVELDATRWSAWFTLLNAYYRNGNAQKMADVAEHLAAHAAVAFPALHAQAQQAPETGLGVAATLVKNPAKTIRLYEATAAGLRAQSRWEAGERHGAVADIRAAIRRWPDQLPTWAGADHMLEQDASAVIAIDTDSADLVERTWAALVCHARGEHHVALKLLAGDLQDSRADFVYPLVLRSRIYDKLDDATNALRNLDLAIDRAPETGELRVMRARLFSKMNRRADAIADYSRAIDTDIPYDVDIRLARGELYRLTQRPKEAFKDFLVAYALAPNSPVVVGSVAQSLAALERTSEALTAFDQALELDPHLKWARVDRAWARLAEGDVTGATEDANLVLADDPNNMAMLALRARVLLQSEKVREAVETARQLLAQAPDDSYFKSILAETLVAAGRHDEAIELGHSVAPEDRPNELRRQIGLAALAAKRWPIAIEELEAWAEAISEDGFCWYEVGRAHRLAGNPADADEFTMRALRKDEDNLESANDENRVRLNYNLGLYYIALGQTAEAEAAYREALGHTSEVALETARDELAELRNAGGPAEAVAAAEQILEG